MPTVASPLGHPTGPKLLHAHEASIHDIHNAGIFINIMQCPPTHPTSPITQVGSPSLRAGPALPTHVLRIHGSWF